MHKYRLTELLCIALVAVFIFYSFENRRNTIEMTAAEISEEICSADSSALVLRDRAHVREQLGFDPESFESFISYSSDDVMNVREIFIGVAEKAVDNTVIKAVEAYKNEKFNLYNGYAPEASALLKNAVIMTVENVFIFIVSENAEAVISAFNSLL